VSGTRRPSRQRVPSESIPSRRRRGLCPIPIPRCGNLAQRARCSQAELNCRRRWRARPPRTRGGAFPRSWCPRGGRQTLAAADAPSGGRDSTRRDRRRKEGGDETRDERRVMSREGGRGDALGRHRLVACGCADGPSSCSGLRPPTLRPACPRHTNAGLCEGALPYAVGSPTRTLADLGRRPILSAMGCEAERSCMWAGRACAMWACLCTLVAQRATARCILERPDCA